MRIKAETILDLARNKVEERVRQDATILAAYLCGAALEPDYLLGGTMDIDLVSFTLMKYNQGAKLSESPMISIMT